MICFKKTEQTIHFFYIICLIQETLVHNRKVNETSHMVPLDFNTVMQENFKFDSSYRI